MQSVQVSDIVTMLPACDKTCWVGVSMHCDDYGVARGLPVRSTAVLSVVVVAMMVQWRFCFGCSLEKRTLPSLHICFS